MNLKNNILDEINLLLEKPISESPDDAAEATLAVTNLFGRTYGPHSPQAKMLETMQKQAQGRRSHVSFESKLLMRQLHGFLRTLQVDVEEGRIVNVVSEAQGEVLGDLLVSARKALDDGYKDVAAVLACASLEDTLKRCATDRGLNVQNKTMSTVVNTLRNKGVIPRTQKALLSEFVKIRNRAFHAQWDEIDVREVEDIARFTEEFLAKQFLSPLAADSSTDSTVEVEE